MEKDVLQELITLSRDLALEERQLVILAEGNTSADCGDGTFWIKASGCQLRNITEPGFSRVRMAAVQEIMEAPHSSDEQVDQGLRDALVNPDQRKPSVETFLHACCLSEGGARWVAHTHPVSVNRFLCSQLGAEPFLRHLFPDAIVVCGKIPAVIPYVDPGLTLAHTIRKTLRDYRQTYGKGPKMLLMVNHGLVALGQTAQEALNISLMADKWARVLQGVYALGGPEYMPESEVERIDSRLDEHYRRRLLDGSSS